MRHLVFESSVASAWSAGMPQLFVAVDSSGSHLQIFLEPDTCQHD